MKKWLLLSLFLGMFMTVVGCGSAENPANAPDKDAKVEGADPPKMEIKK